MGTRRNVIVQLLQFLGYACWGPVGTIIYKTALGEGFVTSVDYELCIGLAIVGCILHIVAVWILPRPQYKTPVEYKIVGERTWI